MNFSVKSFLVFFLAGLVIFSLILGLVFSGIFRSFVSEGQSGETAVLPISQEKREVRVFCQTLDKNTEMTLCVITVATPESVTLIPLYGSYLVEENGALFYVHSRFSEQGADFLCRACGCIVGENLTPDDLVDLSMSEPFGSVLDLLSGNFPTSFSQYFETDLSASVSRIVMPEFKIADNCQIVDFSKCLSKFSQ